MVHVIWGYGEVGKAVHKVIGKALWNNKQEGTWNGEMGDVAHVCFPYSNEFKDHVRFIKNGFPLVIVHSSVPVGTCDKLGVVHSPIRGVHPNLEQGIRTFTKYFGGKDARKAAKIFSDLGLKTKVYKDAKTTEALKLWDTTQYGRLIMLEKEIYAWCKKHKVDFDAIYTEANQSYNKGYTKLGMAHVVRPWLKHMEGPIGGHCVLPNVKLLGVKL
jgi:UDP-N-acetyl-D-mannosaminuronate dehydrogenase